MTGAPIIDELRRKLRVADFLISAHSMLAERYRKLSVMSDVGLMLTSFSVLVLSIVQAVAPTRVSENFGQMLAYVTIAGTALIFVLSVIEWRISWRSRSDAHRRAAEAYSAIKGQIRSLLSRGLREGELRATQVEDRYDQLAESCIQIPNGKFVRLKRAHLRKIALSRLLDDHPFAWATVVRFRFILRQTAKGWSNAA